MADRPTCGTCRYSTGNGTIIICTNKTHYGMAMNATAVCDYFERYKAPIKRSISDTIKGKDAGG